MGDLLRHGDVWWHHTTSCIVIGKAGRGVGMRLVGHDTFGWATVPATTRRRVPLARAPAIGKADRGASGCAWPAMIRPAGLRYRPRHGAGRLRRGVTGSSPAFRQFYGLSPLVIMCNRK